MIRQDFDWGYVQWIKKERFNLDSNIIIGLTHIYPKVTQKPHTHYANEQVLYILEGEGQYVINNEPFNITPGNFYFVPANGVHQTINKSNKPIKELVISIPVNPEISINNCRIKKDESLLIEAIKSFNLKSLIDKGYPMTIVDSNYNFLLENPYLPTFLNKKNLLNKNTFVETPIKVDGIIIGYIYGWYYDEASKRRIPITNSILAQSTKSGMIDYFKKIASGIEEYIKVQEIIISLVDKDKDLKSKESDLKNMELILDREKIKSHNLKINHHFLFNTLNNLAALSLTGDRKDLYKGIIDLSDMLRYSSQSEFKMTNLKNEIDHVKMFLRLQKRRYDTMETCIEVDDDVLNFLVPYIFLQPIVENAFTHGFMKFDGVKVLKIICKKKEDKIEINIMNNGILVDMATANRINERLKENNGHGLNLIYEKLRNAYGDNFKMAIGQREELTTTTIVIPGMKND